MRFLMTGTGHNRGIAWLGTGQRNIYFGADATQSGCFIVGAEWKCGHRDFKRKLGGSYYPLELRGGTFGPLL